MIVNTLIAIAIIAAGGIFYWVFYRALPTTSGTLETRVSQPVTVERDARGVPHIRAKSLDDAWFSQGYTTAEDRMFQMDGLRRLAAGELAEIGGPAALESDREARRLRMRRIAEQAYVDMPAADKVAMQAYARGVNAYLESHRGRYGFEFVLAGYDPRPWSVVDSLLCGMQMFRTLTSDWRAKLSKAQMVRGGEPEKVKYLFPAWSGAEFSPGGDVHAGSNAWAVSGALTATGKPMLSNDMHLEFSIPGVWYMTHLQAPGMNAIGVSLPGMPGIVSGHNDRIAWGMTNLGFDVMDLYEERMDTRTGQYAFAGKVEQARAERELIAVKGAAPEEMTTWVTRHGPLFLAEKGSATTLRWVAAERGAVQDIFLDVNRARNWDEFKVALSRFGGPGQNFVYADVDGNIGYHAAGRLPVRHGYAGDVPVDGASGKFEWEGFIPFEELPQNYNPPNGLVVTANQNPFPEDYRYTVGGSFASPYRSRQILNMLGGMGHKLTPEDSLRIQKDVYSGFHRFLGRQLAAALEARGASSKGFAEMAARLRTWDGQMDQERPEPFLTTLAFGYVRKALAERASPGNGAVYDAQIAPAVIEKILRARPAGWFSDYNEMLLRSFADAMDEGRRIQGGDVSRWKWGRSMFLAVKHPIGSRLPLVDGFFNLGPVPMSGGSTTVKQTSPRLGPSERIDISLGSWDASQMNVPIGQSGHAASSHYKDEWDAYYAGRSFPMEFEKVRAKSTVTFVPGKTN